MYEQFFGLSHDPFRLTPDPSCCFGHRHYAKARAYIDYALHRGEGFVMITGRPGTGKTTLAMDLIDKTAGTNVKVVLVVSTQLDAEDLLRMTAFLSDLDTQTPHKAAILQRLTDFFVRQKQQGRRVLLVIDEAQDLSVAALEELRLLTNLQHRGEPLVPIVLLGQESFLDMVRRPGMEQVHQRILAAWHLSPLDPAETVEYVRFRLQRAGWRGVPSFDPGVLRLVYQFSQGVPRRINLVCGRLLLHAFGEERRVVTLADAEAVVAELAQEGLEPATAGDSSEGGDGSPDGGLDWAEIDRGLGWVEPVASDAHAGVPESTTLSERAAAPVSKSVEDSVGSPAGAPLDEMALAESRAVEAPDQSRAVTPPAMMAAAAAAPAESGLGSSGIAVGEHVGEVDANPGPAKMTWYRWAWASLGVVALAMVVGLGVLVEPAVWASVQDRLERGWQNLVGERSEPAALGGAQAIGEPGPPVVEHEPPEPLPPPTLAEHPSREPRPPETAPSSAMVMETEMPATAPVLVVDPEPVTDASSSPEPEPALAAPAAPGSDEEPTISVGDAARTEAPFAEGERQDPLVDLVAVVDEDPRAAGDPPQASGLAPASDDSVPDQIAEPQAVLAPDLADTAVEDRLVVEPPSEDTTTGAEAAVGEPDLPATREAVTEPDRVAEVTADSLADGEGVAVAAEGLTVRVLFGWDSTRIEPRFEADLAAVVDAMSRSDASLVEIVGYTDRQGDPRYNRYLSQQRAQAVSDHLAERGVARHRHRVEGRGPREPDGHAGIPRSEIEPEDRMVKVSVIPAPGI